MTSGSAGGFEYGGHGFQFHSATCELESGGYLSIEAVGRNCGLSLVGVPFLGVSSFLELPGRSWEPDEEELALHADVFAEGGLSVREKDL